MKNLTLFLAIFLSAIIISCTIQNRGATPAKVKPTDPVVITKPGKLIPIIVTGKSSPKDTVYKYLVKEVIKEVAVTDTAALSKWWKNLEARIRAEHAGETDSSLMAILAEYKNALKQNNNLFQNFKRVKKEKDKAVEQVDTNKKVIYEIPLIMYIILATIVAIVIARQQYLKTKLERQIRDIKQCRYNK